MKLYNKFLHNQNSRMAHDIGNVLICISHLTGIMRVWWVLPAGCLLYVFWRPWSSFKSRTAINSNFMIGPSSRVLQPAYLGYKMSLLDQQCSLTIPGQEIVFVKAYSTVSAGPLILEISVQVSVWLMRFLAKCSHGSTQACFIHGVSRSFALSAERSGALRPKNSTDSSLIIWCYAISWRGLWPCIQVALPSAITGTALASKLLVLRRSSIYGFTNQRSRRKYASNHWYDALLVGISSAYLTISTVLGQVQYVGQSNLYLRFGRAIKTNRQQVFLLG